MDRWNVKGISLIWPSLLVTHKTCVMEDLVTHRVLRFPMLCPKSNHKHNPQNEAKKVHLFICFDALQVVPQVLTNLPVDLSLLLLLLLDVHPIL